MAIFNREDPYATLPQLEREFEETKKRIAKRFKALEDSLDKYTRSTVGNLEWTNTEDGNKKYIMKSALAFWNGAYSGTSSNLSRCTEGRIMGTNYINSMVSNIPSDGQLTIDNTSIGGRSDQKILGVIVIPQYSNGVTIKHNFDASTASQTVLNFYKADGTAFSGAMRYLLITIANGWQ